jgi:hypothetical protein
MGVGAIYLILACSFLYREAIYSALRRIAILPVNNTRTKTIASQTFWIIPSKLLEFLNRQS